jgi:hypothetical protein
MVMAQYQAGPHSPLRPEELRTVQEVLEAVLADNRNADLAATIVQQAGSLECFGDLLARYPSPLEEQTLGDRRRGLDTLVAALCSSDRAAFALQAPTQAIVGRALNLAQINFYRMLWHVCGLLRDKGAASRLRERTALRLRTAVYTQLVEEVLSDLATDHALPRELRELAVRHLAQLWGHRLTWRVSEFFPVLEATWEARARVRVVGGSLMGTSEMFQLLTMGCDERFVELLTERDHGELEAQAFREFLFGRSSEELERLTERMARDDLTSIELDSRISDRSRDAGSVFYEFFQARSMLSNARRLASLAGPHHTAEGYVVMAWLQQTVS